MATLIVEEYVRLGSADGARVPAPEAPANAMQTLTYTTSAVISTALAVGTRVVFLTAAGAVAYVKFGLVGMAVTVANADAIIPDGATRAWVINKKAGITHIGAYDGSS